MKKTCPALLVLLAFLALVPACTHTSSGDEASVASGTDPSAPGTPASASGGTSEQDQREGAIYAAVIRRLIKKDHTYGGADPGFRVVYVLDGPIPDAGDPEEASQSRTPAQPFSHEVKDAIRFYSKLADLPRVKFVADSSTAVVGTRGGKRPGHVMGRGVLLTLAPIRGEGATVGVGANLWISALAGYWSTYVVKERNGHWSVVGTTGPVAIS
jgi:hypothetical protein